MQVEIKIDDACRETKIIILTDKMTEEINSLVRKLSAEPPQVLSGFRGDTAEILEQPDILRIYASSGKVLAVTEKNIPCAYGSMSWKSGLTQSTLSAYPIRKSSICRK